MGRSSEHASRFESAVHTASDCVHNFICALLGPAASPFYFSRVCIEHEWTDRKLPEIKAPENVANVASYSDFDNSEQ